MAKPSTFPERIGVRLPAGTGERVRKLLGVPEGTEPNYGQVGEYLRAAILDRIAQDETKHDPAGLADDGTVTPPSRG